MTNAIPVLAAVFQLLDLILRIYLRTNTRTRLVAENGIISEQSILTVSIPFGCPHELTYIAKPSQTPMGKAKPCMITVDKQLQS